MTALIGPNNSGKSTALKFFWEFGQTLSIVPGSIFGSHQGGGVVRATVNRGIRTLSDESSVFTEINERPLTVDLHQHSSTFPEAEFHMFRTLKSGEPIKSDAISPISLRVKFDRTMPVAEIFILRDGKEFVVEDSKFYWADGPSGTVIVDRQDDKCFFLDRRNGLQGMLHPTFVPAVRSFGTLNVSANYDLQIGQPLIKHWNNHRRSNNSSSRKLADSIEDQVAKVFGYEQLSISANESDDDFILKINNGKSYLLKDMGSGIAHFLTVLINVIPRLNQLVLIDEPEIGIHASLQVELLMMIARYARGPVLFATHSIGLARSVADKIISFQMSNGESIPRDFERSPSHLETLGELSFSAWRELGCDSVVFVEGVHDVKVMREWLRILGPQYRSVVLPLGGSEFIRSDGAEAIKQVLQVHPKVLVVIDSERTGPDVEMEAKRVTFVSDCERLGIPCLATKFRAIENYFTERAVQAAIALSARSLSEYEKLGNHGWGKSEGFKIAAEMTKEELMATEIGQFLQEELSKEQ
jgi:ABC-type branched-subunit amino acid transport system ATPase component